MRSFVPVETNEASRSTAPRFPRRASATAPRLDTPVQATETYRDAHGSKDQQDGSDKSHDRHQRQGWRQIREAHASVSAENQNQETIWID
jgi:hypothetical protein